MRYLRVFILLAVGGCASPAPIPDFAHRDLKVTGLPELPHDASEVADRLLACTHFSGESLGDGSERDQQVHDELASLKCGEIENDVARMRAKYANNKLVIA